MSVTIPFDNSFARLPAGFGAPVAPVPVAAPKMIQFNTDLAQLLGIQVDDLAEAAQVFGGNQVPPGAEPLAQVYAGHQFGGFSPQLGDGRAVLLGEVIDQDGLRRDIQLKGSGQTPFSRRGDGRAWLGPVLREYVVSEAMHALGVPTTRALAAVSTGQDIMRETMLPGAVLTRVAASHLRVGTFQYFAARGDTGSLQQLVDYAIARHFPDADGPLELLENVVQRQVALVVKWLSLGFIHGVMNTDNTSISGETIDYGPCAFLDVYHPTTVFSSIDKNGRYAYDNQADIIVWNMAQLATSLIPLMPNQQEAVERFTTLIHTMPDRLRAGWQQAFAAKIGLSTTESGDADLIHDLLRRMAGNQADFTNTFRALGHATARDQFADPTAYDDWLINWQARQNRNPDPTSLMARSNPAFIPRNHRIEQMIMAGVEGDFAPMQRLLRVLADPYADQPEEQDLTHPPLPSEVVEATFCGT